MKKSLLTGNVVEEHASAVWHNACGGNFKDKLWLIRNHKACDWKNKLQIHIKVSVLCDPYHSLCFWALWGSSEWEHVRVWFLPEKQVTDSGVSGWREEWDEGQGCVWQLKGITNERVCVCRHLCLFCLSVLSYVSAGGRLLNQHFPITGNRSLSWKYCSLFIFHMLFSLVV